VGVRSGRIVALGTVDESARQTLDAAGQVVAPGFVDPHTHYDAQLHWDPFATPSSLHGVTSVIGGNCGFTLAPLHERDADYTRRMMARVEGMPLPALESGAAWDWESFSDYLGGLDGRIGVNAGFLVGHCALRRYVMGDEAVEREAKAEEVDAMGALLHESLQAGGLGLSTSRSSTHSDGDGNPVASRAASTNELLKLCGVVAEHDGTTLEAMVEGCLKGFSPDEIELLATMSAQANRPVNWNVLSVNSSEREPVDHQLLAAKRAREVGGRVVALTMPVPAEQNMSLGTFCALWLIPGWEDVLKQPAPEKARQLRDPEVRAQLLKRAEGGSTLSRLADFSRYHIGDTVSPANAGLAGRLVSDIAAERGVDAFQCVVDIAIEDDFKTVLWPLPAADTPDAWALRRQLWDHPDVLLGGSDAGAHLDRMLGSPYPTRFIADSLRGRQLVSLEHAVHLITDVPARLFGLRDRGRLEEGTHADVVVFDPLTIDSGRATRVYDLPGESLRLTATSSGITRVLVNGVESVVDGEPTGAIAGQILRSGRDTETVTTN
jgi:N-acyl-D-aspartate/D-glutamate deacylase